MAAEQGDNDIKLTDQQLRFADEYLIDLNATQAAIRAGYSEKTARSQGQRLLTNVDIQQYIQQRQKTLQNKLEITQERVLQEYARIAFFDIRKIYSDNGTLKEIHEIDEDSARALAGVETDQSTQFGQVTGETKKVKVHNKIAALDSLCKVMGFNAPEKKEVTGKDGQPLFNPAKLDNNDLNQLITILSKTNEL